MTGEPDGNLGVYIHVPFCIERCSYCAFYTEGGGIRDGERFLRAVETDLARTADALAAASGGTRPAADTIYLGGGTPSLLSTEAVGRLLDACRRAFAVRPAAEVTIEMTPGSVEEARARGYLARGVNRFSLGAESFDDAVLARVGRRHDAAGVRAAVAALRRAGVEELSLDLIAGLPGSTVRGFLRDVDAALALEPDHLSTYLLEVDKPTPLGRAVRRGKVALPDDEQSAEMLAGAVALVEKAGYRHYEIANFARPGRESRHNLKYWRDEPFVGVGPSAWSYVGGRRLGRVRDLARYRQACEAGRSPVDEDATLEGEAAAGEALYLGLRLLEGVDLGRLSRRYGLDLQRRFRESLERLAAAGLVAWDPAAGHVRLSSRGLLLANEVFVEFAV